MRRIIFLTAVFLAAARGHAASTIDPLNRYSYGANIGWINWRGDVANGAVIGEYVCSGYIYAANVGWINLGSGGPANGIQYQNNSAADFGLNQDGLGNLRGYAYGANIGWVNFENTGAPKIDLKTGKLSGFVYGANVGWVSLSNAIAFVQTASIQYGIDTDGDGITDAWERQLAGNLTTFRHNGDADGDGVFDYDEYLAGTNPLDPSDTLRITAFNANSSGTVVTITWRSQLSRCYRVQKRADLDLGTPWVDSGLGLVAPDGSTTTRTVTDSSATMRFYRIQAVRPLFP